VLLDQGNEICGRVSCQRGLAEVGLARKVVGCAGVNVCEVAAAATRNGDFFPEPVLVLEERHAPATFAGFDGAHQSSRTGADNDHIIWRHAALK
jgi:hypothetical protein